MLLEALDSEAATTRDKHIYVFMYHYFGPTSLEWAGSELIGFLLSFHVLLQSTGASRAKQIGGRLVRSCFRAQWNIRRSFTAPTEGIHIQD